MSRTYLFCERFKELREARGLSQVQLGRNLGLSKQTISNWENSNISPSIDTIVSIADYFNVSTDYLLGRDEKRYIEVKGLSEKQLALIQMLIDEIRK